MYVFVTEKKSRGKKCDESVYAVFPSCVAVLALGSSGGFRNFWGFIDLFDGIEWRGGLDSYFL